jgi:hypothetical protein
VDEAGARKTRFAVVRNYDGTRSQTISAAAYRVLEAIDADRRLGEVLEQCGASADDAPLMEELFALWGDRYVLVSPEGRST